MTLFPWVRASGITRSRQRHRRLVGQLDGLEAIMALARKGHARGKIVSDEVAKTLAEADVRSQKLISEAVEILVGARQGRIDMQKGEQKALLRLSQRVCEENVLGHLRQNRKTLTQSLNQIEAVLLQLEKQVGQTRCALAVDGTSQGLPKAYAKTAIQLDEKIDLFEKQGVILETLRQSLEHDVQLSEQWLASHDRLLGSTVEPPSNARSEMALYELKRYVGWPGESVPIPVPVTGDVMLYNRIENILR